MDLKNKIVVITGASRGLGAAFAEVLANSGSKVVICSSSKSGLDAVRKKISSSGGYCDGYVVDVTKSGEVEKFIDATIKKHKSIDILINNAGVIHTKEHLELIKDSEYTKTMQANVDSVFYFLKNVIPQMRKQNSGVIVNVSSGAGKRAYPGLSIYSASKFAVRGLTHAVAKELEETSIKCIALCPGGINTQMRAAIFGKADAAKQQSPHAVAEILKDILLGKVEVPNGADVTIADSQITEIDDNLNQ